MFECRCSETLIKNVNNSPHPNAFLTVYGEVYNLVEMNSVPRFLELASTNINLPKQLLWYICGTIHTIISITLAVILLTMVPSSKSTIRAYRLIPTTFAFLGAVALFAAWRGYCSQPGMRNTRQLHSWELADSDEESAVFVERVLNSSMSGDATKANLEHMLADIATKPNFAERASIAPFVTWHANSSRDEASSDKASLTHIIESQPRSQPRRPPIFGPEIVVQDPRVKAVHRQILYDLCVFTLCYTLIFAAVVFSIPGRYH